MDDDGFEEFCTTAHPRLVAALAHHCGDPRLAEELAQEALVRAGVRWATVGRLESPLGWTYRVGANLAASWFRRRAAERRAAARAAARPAGAQGDDRAEAVAVRAALAALTPRQREVVLLRYYLDLSVEQAAQLTRARPGAVRALTHRALAVLRHQLGDEVADQEEAHHAV